MVKRKYVIFKGIQDEYAMIFMPKIQHKFVRVMHQEPIAGGFVDIGIKNGDLFIHCYGRSMSLGVNSRGEIDEKVIRQIFDF